LDGFEPLLRKVVSIEKQSFSGAQKNNIFLEQSQKLKFENI